MNSSKRQSLVFDLQHDEFGRLVLVEPDGARHVGVEPVRCFPISDPDHWISICDATGSELASVEDLQAISVNARQVLERDLERREFVPRILSILFVPADSEPTEWEVETDRGRTRLVINSADDVRRLGQHRALVIDAQGIRYLIGDLRKLDPASRRILDRYL